MHRGRAEAGRHGSPFCWQPENILAEAICPAGEIIVPMKWGSPNEFLSIQQERAAFLEQITCLKLEGSIASTRGQYEARAQLHQHSGGQYQEPGAGPRWTEDTWVGPPPQFQPGLLTPQ